MTLKNKHIELDSFTDSLNFVLRAHLGVDGVDDFPVRVTIEGTVYTYTVRGVDSLLQQNTLNGVAGTPVWAIAAKGQAC